MADNKMTALKLIMLQILFLSFSLVTEGQDQPFKVLVVASPDPDHGAMIIPSQAMLEKIGTEYGFTVDFTRDASVINDENLVNYKVVVQLHLAYFEMTQREQIAMQHFISMGKGWVGIHAAGLTGKQFISKETPYWDWYQKMIGDVTYTNHPSIQTGTIKVEDQEHPVMKNLPASFSFYDEWYEFNKNPRANVHVLATADETTYKQVKPAGDHPIIWTNPQYDRVIYIGVGHDVTAITDPNFQILMRDAILWAASPMINKERHTSSPKFNVLVLAERGGDHEGFVVAALDWLDGFAAKNNFDFTVVNHASEINAKMLSKYKEIIQLNYAPYGWGDTAMSAFVKYIEQGRGGWVGFHHASLLGEFDGYPMWDWFSKFMGGIRFKNYIAAKASATVNIEDKTNPVMKGVPSSFTIPDDEWYTFNINPRPNVHVMATVDESTYKPMSDIKMGDHPVIWTNEKVKAKNIYFLIGHSPSLLKSEEFRTMFGNAIMWAAE